MSKMFFISSSGSMATSWLSKVLSAGPSIRCFHGSIGLQDTFDDKLEVISALKLLDRWSVGQTVSHAGIVHLSTRHGVSALGICKTHDVPFCALVRNPVLATDSQFQERLNGDQLSASKVNSFRKQFAMIPSLNEHLNAMDIADLIFFRCAQSVIIHLVELEIHGCATFKFEEYTVNYNVIRQLLHHITAGKIEDDEHVEAAFHQLGKVNTHRKKNISAEDTWLEGWSGKQRQGFKVIWKHYSKIAHRPVQFYPDLYQLVES